MRNPEDERKQYQNYSDYPYNPQRHPHDNYSHYQGPLGYQQQQQMQLSQMMGQMMGSNPSEMQLQMMMKLFEELKGIIKMQHENQMSILNDKKLLQETISKMNPYFLNGAPNPIMMTQQVPPPPPQQQR